MATASPIAPLLPSNRLSRKAKSQQGSSLSAPSLLHQQSVALPSRVDPTRVRNLFMLTMALHTLARDNSAAAPELPLQSFELGSVYKYCMWKAAEDAQTSLGKNSNLWKALNARLIEEAALVGDPRAVIALMATDQIQGDMYYSLQCLSHSIP